MEGIKITIQVETGTENIRAVAESGYQDENVAVYIDKEHRVWGLGEAIALATIDTYGERSQSEMIGNSDYIIIFDVRADVVNVVGIFHQLENYLNKL